MHEHANLAGQPGIVDRRRNGWIEHVVDRQLLDGIVFLQQRRLVLFHQQHEFLVLQQCKFVDLEQFQLLDGQQFVQQQLVLWRLEFLVQLAVEQFVELVGGRLAWSAG